MANPSADKSSDPIQRHISEYDDGKAVTSSTATSLSSTPSSWQRPIPQHLESEQNQQRHHDPPYNDMMTTAHDNNNESNNLSSIIYKYATSIPKYGKDWIEEKMARHIRRSFANRYDVDPMPPSPTIPTMTTNLPPLSSPDAVSGSNATAAAAAATAVAPATLVATATKAMNDAARKAISTSSYSSYDMMKHGIHKLTSSTTSSLSSSVSLFRDTSLPKIISSPSSLPSPDATSTTSPNSSSSNSVNKMNMSSKMYQWMKHQAKTIFHQSMTSSTSMLTNNTIISTMWTRFYWWSLAAIAVYGIATTVPKEIVRQYGIHHHHNNKQQQEQQSNANTTTSTPHDATTHHDNNNHNGTIASETISTPITWRSWIQEMIYSSTSNNNNHTNDKS